MSKIKVLDTDISIIHIGTDDFISLTDMVSNHDDGPKLIEKWLNNKSTIDFLGVWEELYNPNFKTPEFRGFRENTGSGGFFMSVKKWTAGTAAIGIIAKKGRYGGTYAHKDIAFEFCSYISPKFKLLLIKEFQRLKEKESNALNQVWDYRRFLTKSNYKIQTDAVKDHILPLKNLTKGKEGIAYAEEADLLYLVMFGYSSSTWRKNNPDLALKGYNLRDFADTHQLIILNNLEILNAELIRDGLTIEQRFNKLRSSAHQQLKSLLRSQDKDHELIKSPKIDDIKESVDDKNLDTAMDKKRTKGKT
ncbi:KilA-N domain-containing protein [Sphingobacterium deserti]|uniref:KilA domain-containing protein n=1 Tax=Sphingobacterium deserti TaxID=1229276 RepID=A0A0B8T2K3_9SPHI|nr:KilA-N domain-containing protein [Sphingobacterium deserti]KGE13093.1 KilA domain-containing protein [Sphingobacterium deserti]